MSSVSENCMRAKNSERQLAALSSSQKNEYLLAAAEALREKTAEILEANAVDLGLSSERPAQFLDRLRLTDSRIEEMAKGLEEVTSLPDPVGEIMESFQRPNGLFIQKVRVPLGVIGIIYEARPNVTADTIGLCIKSGNCVVLRGSSDALSSNRAIVNAVKDKLTEKNLNPEFIQLIEDVTREGADEMMKLNGVIDVLLPRGGAGLIQSVIKNSTIPVIETGTGNCHVYVHKCADFDMAAKILINAKVSRPSVCNAAENLLVDEEIAEQFLPLAISELKKNNVIVKGCERTYEIDPTCDIATDEDFATEFLGYIISVKVVKDLSEAVAHITRFGTKHSESIVTEDKEAAEQFLKEVDAAAVYVNASTRFTDGNQFGFGAELGISTQKLHARGPIGLKELTSYKYVIRGSGQIRE